jgi:hypothetical protein
VEIGALREKNIIGPIVFHQLIARTRFRTQREIATRPGPRAGRGRLMRQLPAEGLTLPALALILSLLVCRRMLRELPVGLRSGTDRDSTAFQIP